MLLTGSTTLFAQSDTNISFDKIKTPTKLEDIIDTFHRLKYNFISIEEGEKKQDLLIEYQYQGKEKLQGTQVDKISFETLTGGMNKPSLMKLWLNDDEIVQIEHEGELIPGEMADMIKDRWLQSIFFPFYNFKELKVEEIAQVAQLTKSRKMLGEKEVDVYKIEGDKLAKFGLDSGVIELADFEKFIMVISFEYLTLEGIEGKFKVGVIELR